jgi:hypothetical protein
MSMKKPVLKIHAIIKALNEENFIIPQLDTIYEFCDRISIISQYDRDWYGKKVTPDNTASLILNYPDPEGKIHFCVRRVRDETSAVNMEMLSFNKKSYKGIIPHGSPFEEIAAFHNPPDYFWYVDADEIYDVETLPAILNYLALKRPRAMRVCGYNYLRTWNNRVPREHVDFTHFGFIKAGILLEQHRNITWNESRLSKLLKLFKLPDFSASLFGFITCPIDIGVFHHGCWLGNNSRIAEKFSKSSHIQSHNVEPGTIDSIPSVYISTKDLPINIREAKWPENYIDTNE